MRSSRCVPRSRLPYGATPLWVLALGPALTIALPMSAHAQITASPAPTDPVSATTSRSPGGRKAIAYRIHLVMGGDTTSASAVTSSNLSAFLDASGQPTQLAGDAVGGTPVTPLPIGILQDAWVRLPHPPPSLLDASPIGDISNAATLDSVHIDLSDAGSGPAIDGHATRHMTLQVETFAVAVDTSGRKTPFRGAGGSDLWFASDLPFSWLPLGGTNGPIAEAIPLAHSIPAAGTYVADVLAPRLRKLGLLLRADVRDSVLLKDRLPAKPGWGSDLTIVRKIWVDSIGPATTVPPAASYAGMQHISELRMRLASTVAMMTAPECGALAGRTGGSFDLTVTGPPSTRLSGRAFSLPPETGRMTAPAHLILEAGKAAGPATTCLWISLPKGAVRTGSFPLSAGAGPDPTVARAFEIVITPGGGDPRAIGLVETGTLEIRSARGGSVAGTLTGTGWRLEVDPTRNPPKGTLNDDLGFKLKFEAAQEAPDSEGAAGDTPGSFDNSPAPSATAPVPPNLDAFVRESGWNPQDVWTATPDPRGRGVAAALQALPSTDRQNPPRVLIHDLATGNDIGPLELRGPLSAGSGPFGLAYSPDGSTLAVGGAGRVVLLRANDGTQFKELVRSPNGGTTIRNVAFTPDGSAVVALVGDELVTWDPDSGEVTGHWSTGEEHPRRLAVSPDGSLVATGGDTGIVLRRLADGSIACIGSPGRILGVAFGPEGHRVAGWGYDGIFRVMDPDCANRAQWPGKAKVVTDVAFRGDGATLLAAGSDGVLRAWDVATHAVDSSLRLGVKGPFMMHPFDHDRDLLVVDLSAHSAQIWKAP